MIYSCFHCIIKLFYILRILNVLLTTVTYPRCEICPVVLLLNLASQELDIKCSLDHHYRKRKYVRYSRAIIILKNGCTNERAPNGKLRKNYDFSKSRCGITVTKNQYEFRSVKPQIINNTQECVRVIRWK